MRSVGMAEHMRSLYGLFGSNRVQSLRHAPTAPTHAGRRARAGMNRARAYPSAGHPYACRSAESASRTWRAS